MDNGFQFIDIIFFAMIAAFLVLRLRSSLGRRDGHKGSDDNFLRRASKPEKESAAENVIPLPNQSTPTKDSSKADDDESPLNGGLAEIREMDPDFDPEDFVSGARMAFELVLNAYSSGDTKTLKPLLSNEVYSNFSQSIRDRNQAGETLEDTLIGIKKAEVVEAYMENSQAHVTVKLVSEQVNATRDENGDVVNGDPDLIIEVTDFWTFARDPKSRDPNWSLVATRSLD